MNDDQLNTLHNRVLFLRDRLRIAVAYSTRLPSNPKHDEVEIVLRGPAHKLEKIRLDVAE